MKCFKMFTYLRFLQDSVGNCVPEVYTIMTQLGYYALRQMSNSWYLLLFFCDLNHNKDFKLSLDTVCLLYT